MAALQWSEGLALDLPLMDETHEEFVALLAAVEQAGDEALLPAWRALVAHTTEHFAREDAWMAATRFASGNCHSLQHKVVLQVMGEARPARRRASLPCCATWLASWRCGSPSTPRPWMLRWPCTCAAWATIPPAALCMRPARCRPSPFMVAAARVPAIRRGRKPKVGPPPPPEPVSPPSPGDSILGFDASASPGASAASLARMAHAHRRERPRRSAAMRQASRRMACVKTGLGAGRMRAVWSTACFALRKASRSRASHAASNRSR